MSIARAYADKDTWITEASVTSNFGQSPILEVWNKINDITKRKEFARGLSSFSSNEISKILGCHSNEIKKILGYVSKSEIVHKDDMVKV